MSIFEWLIDDTADIGNARVFVVHTVEPRFVGEIVPDDEAPISGVTISATLGQTVCNVLWIDEPIFDVSDLCKSLAIAIGRHDASRGC